MPPTSTSEPVVGFKALRIFGQSTPVLISQNDFGDIWLPGWNQALCAPTSDSIAHPAAEVPATTCKCGWHVWASLELAQHHADHHLALQGPTVVALILGAGNLELHPGEGWRSEYAKIIGLVADPTPAPLPWWHWAQSLTLPWLPQRDYNTAQNPSPQLLRLAQTYSARLLDPAKAEAIASEYGPPVPADPPADDEWEIPFKATPELRPDTLGDRVTMVGGMLLCLALTLVFFGLGQSFLLPTLIIAILGGLITSAGVSIMGFENLHRRRQERAPLPAPRNPPEAKRGVKNPFGRNQARDPAVPPLNVDSSSEPG